MRAKVTMSERTDAWSRPSGATICKWWVKQLGGASADAQSYWQGRFAACAFVERVWHTGRPRNGWGVAPNPTRGAASGLRKGDPPLDPSARLSWSLLHAPSACLPLLPVPLSFFCFRPICSLMHFRQQRHTQFNHMLHRILQQLPRFFHFLRRTFQQQFVMHLQNQPTFQPLPA